MYGDLIQLLREFLTAQNLNRAGMILGFFSFWFAAPELLGEQRLVRLRDTVGYGLKALPSLASKVLAAIIFLTPPVILILIYRQRVFNYVMWSQSHWIHLLVGGVLEEVIWTLLLILAVLVQFLALEVITRYVARPLLTALADKSRLRQNSLVLGAVLFVFGFILQFLATFF